MANEELRRRLAAFDPDEFVRGAHCRYCDRLGDDEHPAIKCKGDVRMDAQELGEIIAFAKELEKQTRATCPGAKMSGPFFF